MGEETEPTPRPWFSKADPRRHLIFAPDHVCIIALPEDARGRADAALIVRAVNAHDELVGAAAEIIDCFMSVFPLPSDDYFNVSGEDLNRLALALAKAKGETK